MKREDRIQQILTYLTFAEDWVFESQTEYDIESEGIPAEQLSYITLPLSYFNGAELIDVGEDFDSGALKSYETMVWNPFHKDNRELLTMDMGLWQHCGMGLPGEEAPKRSKSVLLYHMYKFRKMPLSEVRGRFKLMTGDLVEWSHAWIYNDGAFHTNRAIYERRGERWWCIGQPMPVQNLRPEGDAADQAIFAAKSFAFTRYYDWHVEIGFQMPGRTMMPTVSLATDTMGARSAYRLRDLPAGKSRREALRHWVTTHWRKNAHDPEEEIKIWAHLRGVEEFSHNGLKCRIIPSAYDLKKAAEYQKKAKVKPSERRKVS
jgi:hypothetical protein